MAGGAPGLARYGRSPAPQPPGRAGALGYAAALDEVLDGLCAPGSAPVTLTGNSVGGYAALRQALDRPERVRALVLVAPGGFTRFTAVSRRFVSTMASERRARWLVGPLASLYTARRNVTSRAALRGAYAVGRDPQRLAVHCAVWRSFLEPAYDLRRRAAELSVPTLLTWGRTDPVLPVFADGRTASRVLAGARSVRFWSGHEPHAEVPEAWLRVVRPFLAQHHPSHQEARHGTAS